MPRSTNPDNCDQAAPSEIAGNVQPAIEWLNQNQNDANPQTVVMYAWNKFSEGGWLTPTRKSGHDRLQANKNVVNPPGSPKKYGALAGYINSARYHDSRRKEPLFNRRHPQFEIKLKTALYDNPLRSFPRAFFEDASKLHLLF